MSSDGVFQAGAATSNCDNAVVRIGIDLDGVCYDFAVHLRRYLVEWLGHAPEPYEHLHSWDFWTRWGWDETSIPTDIFVEDYLPNYEKLRAAGTTAYLINREWNAPYDDGRNRVADIGEFARVVLDTAEQRQ